MKKKVLALAMALAMLASLVTVPAGAAGNKTFPDAVGHWAEESILRWSRCGLVKGDEVGNVNPNKPLRRCEMATILSDMLGLRTAAPISTFKDINGDEWYARAILRCAAAGIMEGSNSMSYPEDHITREEAITMFGRALGVQPSDDPDLSDFLDGDKVSGWAAPYMATLTELGILSGMGDGTVAPHADINRAGAFTLMDKAISVYANAPGVYTSQNANGFVVVNANDHQGGDVTITGKATGVMVTVGETNTVRFRDLTADNILVNGKGDVTVTGKSAVDALAVNTEIAVNVDKDATVGTMDVKAEKVSVTNAGTVKTLNCAEVGNVTNSGKVETLVADAASAITNTGTVDQLVANAGITVNNTKGTVKNAEINMGGVVMDGPPQQMTLASGVARPANSSGRPISATGAVSSGGGGSSNSSSSSTPSKPKPGIKLNKSTATVTVGEAPVVLKATVTLPTGVNAVQGEVQWTSSDPEVAAVDKGTVTGLKAGTAKITATVVVTIPDPTPSPSPDPSETVKPTETTDPTETPTGTPTETAEPTNPTEEGGDNTGTGEDQGDPPAAPAAVRAGAPVVHADKTETYTATCTVTVKPAKPVAVTGVTLSQTELTLEEGKTADLTATIAPENATNKNMTWSSSDPATAEVDENGHVTAKKAGEAVITVTTEDEHKTASCKVTVTEKTVTPPEQEKPTIELNQTTLTLTLQEGVEVTATLNATTKNAGEAAVSWSSSKETVATVENGTVKALTAGETTITAQITVDGEVYKATCEVTVNEPEPPTPTIDRVTLDQEGPIELKVDAADDGNKITITAMIHLSDETTTTGPIEWTVENNGEEGSETVIFETNGNQITVTAAREGEVTIKATATEDATKFATCKVTVKPADAPTPPETTYTLTFSKQDAPNETVTLLTDLQVGNTIPMIATLSPMPEDEATVVTYEWKSDNESLVEVTATGNTASVKIIGEWVGEPALSGSKVTVTASINGEKVAESAFGVKIQNQLPDPGADENDPSQQPTE